MSILHGIDLSIAVNPRVNGDKIVDKAWNFAFQRGTVSFDDILLLGTGAVLLRHD